MDGTNPKSERQVFVEFPRKTIEESNSGVAQVPDLYRVVRALDKLQWAKQCAANANCDLWEFSVELSDFLDVGISRQDLRQMVARQWVSHQREVILPNLDRRQFQEEAPYTFSSQSCFVITSEGQTQFEDYLGSSNVRGLDLHPHRGEPKLETNRPIWDRNSRELRLGDLLVKRFKWPANVQFVILDRFAQLNWPERIPNPLPEDSDICRKRRLHDAIKCLNQRRENDLIRFRGDGTGLGIAIQINVHEATDGADLHVA